MDAHLRLKLSSAITDYDRKESAKRFYNIYALGHMLEALQSTEEHIDKGAPIRDVLCGHFTGRLLAKLLKVAGCTPYTKEDAYGSGIRRTVY